MRNPLLLVAAITLGGSVLSGCTSVPRASEADIRVTAYWQLFPEEEGLPHLFVTVHNIGDAVGSVGPGAKSLVISGPGPLGEAEWPVYWGVPSFARPIDPGTAVPLAMHPRVGTDGRPVFAIDHGWGVALTPPPGNYVACIDNSCSETELVRA